MAVFPSWLNSLSLALRRFFRLFSLLLCPLNLVFSIWSNSSDRQLPWTLRLLSSLKASCLSPFDTGLKGVLWGLQSQVLNTTAQEKILSREKKEVGSGISAIRCWKTVEGLQYHKEKRVPPRYLISQVWIELVKGEYGWLLQKLCKITRCQS